MKLKTFVAILLVFVAACVRKITPLPPDAPQPLSETPIDTVPPAAEVPPKTDILPPVVVTTDTPAVAIDTPRAVVVGAARLSEYLPLLKDKTIGLVVNQTSVVHETHLVDTLRSLGIRIRAIFAPEHGFRGTADAGEKIADGKDPGTGIPVISLYGSKRAPSAADLAGVDWILFDIQDVGTRFYTYISTMHEVMQACANNGVKCMVLDRPNPNGHYVDGPILESAQKSFVGMHPVPVVHGMTIGEYARMINGEGWLSGGATCDLTVIPCAHYDHDTPYEIPIKPSPNLPNNRAIYLYPSICYFEGTVISVGRGTDLQFQTIGHPALPEQLYPYRFTPVPKPGAMQPPLLNERCNGLNLSILEPDKLREQRRIDLSYVIEAYRHFPDKGNFFLKTNFFDKLAGTAQLRAQIIAGKSEAEIRASWNAGLQNFMQIRKKYLLYPDFKSEHH